jgi:hypothetical protein
MVRSSTGVKALIVLRFLRDGERIVSGDVAEDSLEAAASFCLLLPFSAVVRSVGSDRRADTRRGLGSGGVHTPKAFSAD